MKSARIYDFTLPANGSMQLNVEGEYLRIMSSTGSVEIVTDVMRLGPLKTGQGQENTPFKRITINDKSGIANIGTILVASSGFVDQRISGTVEVVDGGKNRTLAGSAFSAASSPGPGGASVYTTSYLYNPAGGLVNVVINDLYFSSATAQVIYVVMGTGLPPGNVFQIPSKNSGGVIATALKYDNSIGAAVSGGVLFAQAVQINQQSIIKLTEPLVLRPGAWMAIACQTPNTDLQATRQFFEEGI